MLVFIVVVFVVVVFAAAFVVIIIIRQTDTQTDMQALRLRDSIGKEAD